MTKGYREFEFDLPGALLDRLVSIIDEIESAPLTSEVTAKIPDEQGVYQLLLDGKPVYVGKTDNDAGLNSRLTRHSIKILHRIGLEPKRVSFKSVRIFVFTAVDLETDLIRHYGKESGLAWNGSGFGSNDPGRERDTTKNKPENFDYQFPINIDHKLDLQLPKRGPAADCFRLLRDALPYTLRIQRVGSSRKFHSDIESSIVTSLKSPFTARQAIAHLTNGLPPGWQATKLLGYVILYKENEKYPESEIIARSK
ncbi:MAG: GIY-YIG nuclease family protein [Rhizobiales bacterium]|nr:GIY-YIG nuclease family protein [Hyphomicrobiales bacterium]